MAASVGPARSATLPSSSTSTIAVVFAVTSPGSRVSSSRRGSEVVQ